MAVEEGEIIKCSGGDLILLSDINTDFESIPVLNGCYVVKNLIV